MDYEQWFRDKFSFKNRTTVKFKDKTYKSGQFTKFIADNLEGFAQEGLVFPLGAPEPEEAFEAAIRHILETEAEREKQAERERQREKQAERERREEERRRAREAQSGAKVSDHVKKILHTLQEECQVVNLVDTRDGSCETIFLDNETGRQHSTLRFEAVKKYLRPKELFQLEQEGRMVRKTYQPTFSSEKIEETSDGWGLFNTYDPPEWKLLKGEASQVPSQWLKYLEHLFPKESQREKVLRWVYWSVKDKAYQHLVLVGAQKTGKTIFTKDLLTQLHGKKHTRVLRSNIFKTSFNSEFNESTLLYIDEAQVSTRTQHDMLKQWADDVIAVEKKHRDPFDLVRTFSMVLISNHTGAIYADPINSRKFIYPDISENTLTEVFSLEEIGDLVHSFTKPQLLANFWAYLEQRFKEDEEEEKKGYKEVECWGHTFERMVLDTGAAILRYAVKSIIEKRYSEVSYDRVQADYLKTKKNPRFRQVPFYEVQAFFEAFTWYGEKLAEVDYREEVIRVINPKYLPEESSSEDTPL